MEAWLASFMAFLCHLLVYSYASCFYQVRTVGLYRRVGLSSTQGSRAFDPNPAARRSTQQPFFEVIRRGAVSTNRLRAALCGWLFLPCTLASSEAAARKALEREYILTLGVLNPPCVYALPDLHENCKDRRFDHERIFGTARPVKRLRQIHGEKSKPFKSPPKLDSRKAGLWTIAAALAGHRFPGHKKSRFGYLEHIPELMDLYCTAGNRP